MTDSHYFDTDISDVLYQRGERQLRELIKHIDAHYPSGDFRLMDLGCANAMMLRFLANRYPRATLFGLDLDQNEQYESDWEQARKAHSNIAAIVKGDMLDSRLIRDTLGGDQASVDYLFSHTAAMYLNSEQTRSLLTNAAHYAQIVFSREFLIGNTYWEATPGHEQCARVAEQVFNDIFTYWRKKFGGYTGPMLPYEVDTSAFAFSQYTDSETYGHNGIDGPLAEFMNTAAGFLPELLEESRDDAYKARAREAIREFGEQGQNYAALWLVTVLENRQLR